MLLLVGLGNPGTGYARHRHNIGFMALDEIVRVHGFSPWKSKFHGKLCEGKFGDQKVLAFKPDTYMNLSGQAVAEAVRFHKIDLENVIVFHDDLDLAKAKVRTKKGGGHGGHNGLRSIDALCGADYRRVRMGIGHPGRKDLVHNYVLQDFDKSDEEWLTPLLKSLGQHVGLLVDGDEAGFMNKVTLAVKPAVKAEVTAKPAGKVTRSSSSAPTTDATPTVTVIGKDPNKVA